MSHIPCHHNPRKNQVVVGVLLLGLVMLGIILFAQKKPEYFSGLVPTEVRDMNTGGKNLEQIRQEGLSRYCTFDYKTSGDSFFGQFFTFDGNTHISLISKQQNNVLFFVFDKQKVYTWKSGFDEGFSYRPNPEFVYTYEKNSIDLSTIRDSICWEKPIDQHQFLLPPNVIFNEK